VSTYAFGMLWKVKLIDKFHYIKSQESFHHYLRIRFLIPFLIGIRANINDISFFTSNSQVAL
jgi:hypothetical protein